MDNYAVNVLLMSISTDVSYNEEIRKLAAQLIKSNCSANAKIALIEACIDANKNQGPCAPII